MPALHISKVAVGCSTLDALVARVEARRLGGEVHITTRYRPKRAEELIGGSIYWIVKHRLVARQEVLGFDEAEGGRTIIRLSTDLVAVNPYPKRAHQGWRYLAPADAPPDLGGDGDGLLRLPPTLSAELARLALI